MPKVDLTKDEIDLLLVCARIAFEDGSVFGGNEPEDAEYKVVSKRGDDVIAKLRTALHSR